MRGLSICINTQTPLLLFPEGEEKASRSTRGRGGSAELVDPATSGAAKLAPGGVTRMVWPLVRRLREDGVLAETHWVSLNPTAPETVRLPGVTLHNIHLSPERLRDYGEVKEAIWKQVHGTDEGATRPDLFWSESFSEYAYYNRASAELMRSLDQQHDFDAYYIHDFQQLPVGHMLGTLKPKIFRWHIPFDADTMPDAWRPLLRTYLESYDVVVVSTDRYAKSLRKFGHAGKVVRQPPYVDPKDFAIPDEVEVARVSANLGIDPRDQAVLVVGRMDPSKGQDTAIDALAQVIPTYPRVRLVLVGNGSFSSTRGGLGLSKGAQWRAKLEAKVKALGLEKHVLFTGHVPQHELDCLYERAAVSVLPSVQEGFGLVVVESWLHEKPTLVSNRAGVADLIEEGENGLLFDPSDPKALAGLIRRILAPRAKTLRLALAAGGRATAEQCSLDAAVKAEQTLLEAVVEAR